MQGLSAQTHTQPQTIHVDGKKLDQVYMLYL